MEEGVWEGSFTNTSTVDKLEVHLPSCFAFAGPELSCVELQTYGYCNLDLS